jgi:membrane fusion protein (multidrug efflux system)
LTLNKPQPENPIHKMKNLIYIAIVLVMAACGSTTSENTEVGSLIAKRDSLRTEQDKIMAILGELDKQIASLDSTKRRTLVTTIQPHQGSFEHYFEVYGNVDVKRNAVLFPDNPGNVKSIAVKEGQKVTQGQVLMHLDDELIKRNIDEVETNYQLAKTIYEKQAGLWEQKIGSEVQYLEAKARKEGLENSLLTLQKQLEKSTVRAPFNGVVDDIMIKMGEMAAPGMPLLRIIDLSDFHIEADIPENYISTLNNGDKVDVVFPGVDTVEAKLTSIGSYINPNNRTFKILVDIDAKSGKFMPNQLTVLRINDFEVENAVSLPASAIQQDAQGNSFVFVVVEDGNRAVVHKTTIKPGMTYKGSTHILDGLKGDEQIIDRGSRSVRDLQEVDVRTN